MISSNSLVSTSYGLKPLNTAKPSFGTHASKSKENQLTEEILSQLPAKHPGIDKHSLLNCIHKGQPLTLPKGYSVQYGFLHPNGKVESPYPDLKLLAETTLKAQNLKTRHTEPLMLVVHTPQTASVLETYINGNKKNAKEPGDLKKALSNEDVDPKSGVKSRNVILSDLIEKLVSGNATDKTIPKSIYRALNGQDPKHRELTSLYHIQVPGNEHLTEQLNRPEFIWGTRQKLLGLAIAQKVYAENQQAEWHSIAISLALGVAGEPTINHFFKDGGPVASTVRSAMMSGVDILGNILSVAGVAKENLNERGETLSLKSLYGHKTPAEILKNPWGMDGEAGPIVKEGIKEGGIGGLFGILYNIPAGSILSMPSADIASRSIISGIGAAGSAVAIPGVIKSTRQSFERSITVLAEEGKINLPNHIDPKSKAGKKLIETMALREMNARIGIASSIKATNPPVLAGTGAVILAAEKLGIPRPYVQTAYMALAPVMHNFLRLVYTGIEKFWVIPHRMKTMQKLVYESGQKPLNKKQNEKLDKAFLSGMDEKLAQGVSTTFSSLTTAAVLLTAEVIYFYKALQKSRLQAPKNIPTAPATEGAPFDSTQMRATSVAPNGLKPGIPRPLPTNLNFPHQTFQYKQDGIMPASNT